MNKEKIIIIGAGWAGLAAAMELADSGHDVTLLESAKQTGGRARKVMHQKLELDNGQHIMIGAYEKCLDVMQKAGINQQDVLVNQPLSLLVKSLSGKDLSLAAPDLRAPFHLLIALLKAKGLSFKERVKAAWFGVYMQLHGFKFKKDRTVSALFKKTGQTEKLIKQLWEPLCLAIMNTSVDKASANIFMRVFRDAFTRKTSDSNLLLTKVNLSALFPEAAEKYLNNNDVRLLTQHRATKLKISDNRVTGVLVKTATNEKLITADKVIIATAPQHTLKLISEHQELKSLATQLEQFDYEPIVTVYLQYQPGIQLPKEMIGISGTISQWIFDRGQLNQQAGLMSVVISSSGEHMDVKDDTLIDIIENEIRFLLPVSAFLQDAFVIREKRATFQCRQDINTIRPGNNTPVSGLYLAGDYTDTGYPATLEGAVISGIDAAKAI